MTDFDGNWQNLSSFHGLPVEDYDPGRGLSNPTGVATRCRVEWDENEAGKKFTDKFASLLADDGVERLRALVIGAWDLDMSLPAAAVVQQLVAASGRLRSLEALFFGDIQSEEQEISWIRQCDVTPLLTAFPRLRVLRVRGGDGLSVGAIRHGALEELGFEAGGLPREVIDAAVRAECPSLTHLELWLGTEDYGYDGDVSQFETLFAGEGLPALRTLALRNSEIADEIATAVANAPILDRVDTLDLSMGNLSDVGAQALLASRRAARLRRIDCAHNYLSDSVKDALRRLGPEVDVSDTQEPDDWGDGDVHRYISVSE